MQPAGALHTSEITRRDFLPRPPYPRITSARHRPPPRADYRQVTRVTFVELPDHPDVVVERLLGRLNRSLNGGIAPIPL